MLYIKEYFYLNLYSKDHDLLDSPEIHIFSNLTYTKTLNGIGNLSFNTPINYIKNNEVELLSGMHIELIRVIDNKEECVWYGVIISTTPTGSDYSLVCYGYKELLNKRLFKDMFNTATNANPLLSETYNDYTYGKLIFTLINKVNLIEHTGITLGANIDTNLLTTRIIKWNDDLGSKVDEFITDSSCYFHITRDRKFNFYNTFGENKSDFYEINDSNLLSTSNIIIDESTVYNRVYALNTYTDDNDIEHNLISLKEDINSINAYGLKEKELTVNDLREQSTIDQYTLNELNLCSQPSTTIQLTVAITDCFDIFDIEVGDVVNINSDKLNLYTPIKLLEFTVNLTQKSVSVTLGNTIVRENNYIKYKYN